MNYEEIKKELTRKCYIATWVFLVFLALIPTLFNYEGLTTTAIVVKAAITVLLILSSARSITSLFGSVIDFLQLNKNSSSPGLINGDSNNEK